MELARILRIHDEPHIAIHETTVHSCLAADPQAYLAFLRQSLDAINAGRIAVELPQKSILSDAATGGDFRIMPCVTTAAARRFKSLKLVGTNTVQTTVPDQITVGKAFVLHPEENFITHIVDACLLSSARTGACAALALAAVLPQARSLTIVGAGRVGWYAGLYAATLGVNHIEFRDTLAGRAVDCAKALATMISSTANVTASDGLREGTVRADAVILATTASDPILTPAQTTASVVISLGADHPDQRELAENWAGEATLWADPMPDSLAVGDLAAWHRKGLLQNPHAIPNLLDLIQRPPAEPAARTAFISTGSALLDNLTLDYLCSER